MNPSTDRELLKRYLGGDVSAFEEILNRHEKLLLRYVARHRRGARGGAQESARDIVQEVFLRLVREAAKLEAVENLSAWLYRVARNLAIDEARKEIRMEKHLRLQAEARASGPPPSVEENREIAEIVTEKLLGLPAHQRDVLILKLQEGKTYREIADITGLSTSNVGYLIHCGLKALAGDLRTAGIV